MNSCIEGNSLPLAVRYTSCGTLLKMTSVFIGGCTKDVLGDPLKDKMWATRSCLLRASLLNADMPPNFVHCHSSLCVLHDSLIFFGSSTVVEAAKLSIIELIKSCWRISPCCLVTFLHPYGGTGYKSINLICQVENVWFSQHGIVVFNTTLFFVFDFLLTVVFCLLHYCHNNVISRLHLN